jgi:hypothetical protein
VAHEVDALGLGVATAAAESGAGVGTRGDEEEALLRASDRYGGKAMRLDVCVRE